MRGELPSSMYKPRSEWIENQIGLLRSGSRKGCVTACASFQRGLAGLLGACALLLSPEGADVLHAQTNVAVDLAGRWTNSPGKYATTIKVFQGVAYLGYDNLEVVDVRNPAQPTWLASYSPAEGGAAQRIEVSGSVGFVALYGG